MAHKENGMTTLTTVLLVIAIIGALNWGLIGFFNFNLVDAIFGGATALETTGVSRVVYAIVGLSGLVSLFLLPRWRESERRQRGPAARPAERPV
jgi:uncharacterized protein